jgi:hypothetical protein
LKRNFHSRLERLERWEPRQCIIEDNPLPPEFWWVISGIVSLEALEPDTRRRVVEVLRAMEEASKAPNPIEARLAEMEELVREKEQGEGLAAARSCLPIGLKSPVPNGTGDNQG